jgi:V8-like Glu-specific endopeptidase
MARSPAHGSIGTVAVLVLSACGGIEVAGTNSQSDLSQVGPAALLAPGADPPKMFTDANGRTFALRGRARFVAVEPGTSAKGVDVSSVEKIAPTPPPSASTLDALAERIRPVTVLGEYEYILDRPDYETAQKILELNKRGGSPTPDTEPGLPREGRECCGNDDRVEIGNTTASVMYSATMFSEYGCSGTMISPSVMLTAAHCVYDTVSNAWIQVVTEPSWGGGLRFPRYASAMSNSSPYTHTGAYSYNVTVSGSTYNTVSPGAYIGCYDVTIPMAFVNAETSGGPDDLAIIDFKKHCGYSPGYLVGWWGTWIRDDLGIRTNIAWMPGYPHNAWPGASMFWPKDMPSWWTALWQGTINHYAWYTAQLHRGANIPFFGGDTWRLLYHIDATEGNSGSGIGQFNDVSSLYLIAHHLGWDADHNFGRRFDGTVSSFLRANSVFPN